MADAGGGQLVTTAKDHSVRSPVFEAETSSSKSSAALAQQVTPNVDTFEVEPFKIHTAVALAQLVQMLRMV